MLHRAAADAVLVIHLLFIVFVVAGGFLTLRWPAVRYAHIPVAAWGAMIELVGWTCPLTPLETALRTAAGGAGYAGGFIEHYLVPLIYPRALTRSMQIGMGLVVVATNAVAYGAYWRRSRRSRGSGS